MFDDLFSFLEYTTDNNAKDTYSRDASIFTVQPEGVVYPKSSMDIMQLVRRLNAGKLQTSLTVRAAGTCMSGGPLNEGIIVDTTKYLTGVSSVDTKHRTITVESGAFFRDIESEAVKHGLMFPPYTSSKNMCSIGGMMGNNASGELSVRYGATIDWVESIDVVLRDGNLYTFKELSEGEWLAKQALQGLEGEVYRKVADIYARFMPVLPASIQKLPKNAAGYQIHKIYNPRTNTYNLARLFIAAQGTLGIITAATLCLTPIPKYRRLVVTSLPDVEKIGTILQAIHELHPESVETFDIHTYELAKKYYPEDAERIAYVSQGAPLTFFIQLSEETDEATYQSQKKCVDILRSFGLQPSVPEGRDVQESFFVIRRASFKMLMEEGGPASRVAPCIEDTIIPIESYGVFLQKLTAILQDYPHQYTYAGHIGDGSIRLVPLVDFSAPNAATSLFELSERVYELTLSLGGSVSVDHNDGLIRTYYLEKQYGSEGVALFKELKTLFDPQNLFNPGKKVQTETVGSKDYALQHVLR